MIGFFYFYHHSCVPRRFVQSSLKKSFLYTYIQNTAPINYFQCFCLSFSIFITLHFWVRWVQWHKKELNIFIYYVYVIKWTSHYITFFHSFFSSVALNNFFSNKKGNFNPQQFLDLLMNCTFVDVRKCMFCVIIVV